MFPLSAEDNLKMRHRVSRDLAANAVESQVGRMMLSATVKAAADLDVQILHRFVLLEAFLAYLLAKLRRQSARRRDPQLASVRSGARGDVHQRAGTGVAESDGVQCAE